jgi:WD40 repeat protein
MFVSSPCFTPDGSRLVVTTEGQGIQVWDLRLIRQQLAGIGLDWDMPAYPPALPSAEAGPVRVRSAMGLVGSRGSLKAARFLPDGRRVLAAGADGILRLWDLDDGTDRAASRDTAERSRPGPVPDGNQAL